MHPDNQDAFVPKRLTMNDILNLIWKYTNILNDKNGFSKWCFQIGGTALCLLFCSVPTKKNGNQTRGKSGKN
jgi:hypothetical protein